MFLNTAKNILLSPQKFSASLLKYINMASSASPPKKQKITIGTHDGIFHCDEVLACFMLQQLPEYSGAQIVRTRNDDLLKDCDIVVDVGAVFDRDRQRFDHHQSSFQHTLSSLRPELGDKFKIRLSSAGLIFTYFGEDVIRVILKEQGLPEPSAEQVLQVYMQVYENFIKEMDGIDNGVPMFDGEPAFNISTDLSSRVHLFNATWNADNANYDAAAQFEKAQKLVGSELVAKIVYYTTVWWPARELVANAVAKRFEVHSSGEILELAQFCPWKEHLYLLEPELGIKGIPKYVLWDNQPSGYRVIGVPNAPKSFVCRKFLHKQWRGLRNAELVATSGISGSTFVHASGFVGGAETRAAALEMAVKSLESPFDD